MPLFWKGLLCTGKGESNLGRFEIRKPPVSHDAREILLHSL